MTNELQKTKIIEIKDFNNLFHFKIRLFGALEGLEFFDTQLKNYLETKSVTKFCKDLLPLAIQITPKGDVLCDNIDLEYCNNIFSNPISIVTLTNAILEFQKVFIQGSPIYDQLTGLLNKLGLMKDTGSTTTSEA
jgi:hypothetical protein